MVQNGIAASSFRNIAICFETTPVEIIMIIFSRRRGPFTNFLMGCSVERGVGVVLRLLVAVLLQRKC